MVLGCRLSGLYFGRGMSGFGFQFPLSFLVVGYRVSGFNFLVPMHHDRQPRPCFRVESFGCCILGFGFQVPVSGFQISNPRSRVPSRTLAPRSPAPSLIFKVSSFRCRVWDMRFRVLGTRTPHNHQTRPTSGFRVPGSACCVLCVLCSVISSRRVCKINTRDQ